MPNQHLFTSILCTYNRPAFMKLSVAALLQQTYENMEIILINNGATPETVEHLREVEAADKRVKLVHFKDNVWSADDPGKYIDVCFNAALNIATGDYIWCQSDDDIIAEDYAEKMVALFIDNSECTPAAGIPVSIDAEGKKNKIQYGAKNVRPRYMPGHELALAYAQGDRTKFVAPGYIFTVKRDALLRAGGCRQPLEDCHMYGIVPFGVTGFDDTAILYWRHHEGQLNKELTSKGNIGANEGFALLKDWQIERRWQVFGRDTAREFMAAVEREKCVNAAAWMTNYLYSWNFGAVLRLTRTMWSHPQFWLRTSVKAAERALYNRPVRAILRLVLRRVFRLVPVLSSFSPRLARIRERVNR